GFQPHDVTLPKHQLGRVLDCDDAFGVADIPGQYVQECRLAGACTTRHDEVQSTGNGRFEKFEHWLRQRVARDEIVGPQSIRSKSPDGKHRAFECKGRNNRVDARAVLQSGVYHRARFVDSSPDGADDSFDNLKQMRVVAKDHIRLLETSLAFDVNLVVPV